MQARRARAARGCVAAMLVVLLSACAGPGVKSPAPGRVVAASDAPEREVARVARVQAMRDWSLSGRIAVSNAGKGGSGRVEWSERGDTYAVSLSAPVTRQSWRMSGGPGGARLEGLDGGPREAADADRLLLEATGWDIPVAALREWLRALPAAALADGRVVPGPDGRPLSIEQGGWTIAYQWPVSGDLPARLDARRGQARVRLIVDEWQATPAVAVPGNDAPAPAGGARP